MSFLDFLGGGNTSGDYNQYANQTRQLAGGYNPFIHNGTQAGQWMLPQLHQDAANPNRVQDQWAQGFQMSPYQQNVLQAVSKHMQALGANSGMLGSGQLQKALQGQLSSDVGQFQNDYVNRAMQLHSMGLTGLGNMYQTGLGALGNRNNLLNAANEAQLQGNINRDTQGARNFGGFLGALGSLGELAGGGLFGKEISTWMQSHFKNNFKQRSEL